MANVYILGDSHTEALGPRLRNLLTEHDVVYESFRGHSTARAAAKAKIPTNVDVALVALGGNDFGERSLERAQLVRRLREAGAQVLWFGPALAKRSDVDARHLRQTIDQAEQLPRLGVPFYDSRAWTTTGHRDDGVHFTGSGYTSWAARIADAARNIGVRSSPGLDFAALLGFGFLGWLGLRWWKNR